MTGDLRRIRKTQHCLRGAMAVAAATAVSLTLLLSAVNTAYSKSYGLNVMGPLQEARAVQMHFQNQLQSWTHVLLRGADGEQLVRYRSEFLDEESTVRAGAARLRPTLGGEPDALELLDEFVAAHTGLSERYATALSTFERSDRTDPASADRLVGGGDRQAAELLDRLAAHLSTRASASRREFDGSILRIEWTGAILFLALFTVASLMLRHGGRSAAAAPRLRVEPLRAFTEVGA